MATVIVSPSNVANFARGGGHFWAYMQYVQGLRQLGCEVYWLEHFRTCGDPDQDASTLAGFFERMKRYGLSGKVILYATGGQPGADGRPPQFVGTTRSEAEAAFRRADLLLNFDYRMDASLLACFRRTALVDIDPGLLQFWISTGQCRVFRHDLYFTIGETVGKPSALFPDCGLPWIHIRPPVCLELWPFAYHPGSEAFTTVSSWWGGEFISTAQYFYDNNKRASFLDFIGLPGMAGQTLEVALCFDEGTGEVEERRMLESHGWRVRHAYEVAGTPESYQSYIQRSRGEFSCAKPSCMKFQNAWVSDRTLCYLASGKPAVTQNTGPSSFLPEGEGMFRFSTIEEAVRALAAIDANYQRHCRAARDIAETCFDAKRVAAGILNAALHPVTPASRRQPGAYCDDGCRRDAGGAAPLYLMMDTLKDGLSALRGRALRIRELHRDGSTRVSSFHTERLRVLLEGNEWLPVFFKDLNPQNQIPEAKIVRSLDIGPSRRELLMYQSILPRERAGTPQLYAFRWEPGRGIYWLFLEDVGRLKLQGCGDFSRWVAAAKWAARFHAAARRLPASQTGFLPQYDRSHYRQCAERIERRLPELEAGERELLCQALDRYVPLIDWLSALPRSVIHGEFYGNNIILRSESSDEPVVVDWETAAIGPGVVDLVTLTSGRRWTAEQRQMMCRAYFDQYRAETGLPMEWEGFCGVLGAVSLYHALKWLGFWPGQVNQKFSHRFESWILQLRRILAVHFPGS